MSATTDAMGINQKRYVSIKFEIKSCIPNLINKWKQSAENLTFISSLT